MLSKFKLVLTAIFLCLFLFAGSDVLADSTRNLAENTDHAIIQVPKSISALTEGEFDINLKVDVNDEDHGGVEVEGTTGDLKIIGESGGALNIRSVEQSVTLSGATTSTTSLIASDAIVIGCQAEVTTLAAGATDIDIGDGSDADKWGNDVDIVAGTTTTEDDWTGTAHPLFYTSLDVTLTAVGGAASFSAGVVNVVCHYIDLSALPT